MTQIAAKKNLIFICDSFRFFSGVSYYLAILCAQIPCRNLLPTLQLTTRQLREVVLPDTSTPAGSWYFSSAGWRITV